MIFLLSEEGQGLVEYGLILILIAVAIVIALTLVSTEIAELLSVVTDAFKP